jgi:Nucleoside-diphosphate-sugar epimerases
MIEPVALNLLPELPDIVFHCAGGASVQASIDDPVLDQDRTVTSTFHLTRWLAEVAPQARLVYPSSGAVYGEAACRPHDRTGDCVPISPYGKSKLAAETIVRAAALSDGLAVCIVRLFSVYGPGLRKQLIWDACLRMRHGQADFFGSGLERRDFVEISDVVDLMWRGAGMASSAAPILDGGTGEGVEVRTVLATLASNFDPHPDVRFLGTPHAGNPLDMIADASAARAIGWVPQVRLESGLRSYVDWFRSADPDVPRNPAR